jgi:hypothetical protein
MPFDPNNPTSSLDLETGLLTDIDEVRAMADRLAVILQSIIADPLVVLELMLSPGLKIDIVMAVATGRSMLSVTSQAAFIRNMGQMLGNNPVDMEMAIKNIGVSETLPSTHPDAPQLSLPTAPLRYDQSTIRGSYILSKMDKAKHEEAAKSEEPLTVLPDTLEQFLRDSLGSKGEDHAGN